MEDQGRIYSQGPNWRPIRADLQYSRGREAGPPNPPPTVIPPTGSGSRTATAVGMRRDATERRRHDRGRVEQARRGGPEQQLKIRVAQLEIHTAARQSREEGTRRGGGQRRHGQPGSSPKRWVAAARVLGRRGEGEEGAARSKVLGVDDARPSLLLRATGRGASPLRHTSGRGTGRRR
jgi:hypothetical protein